MQRFDHRRQNPLLVLMIAERTRDKMSAAPSGAIRRRVPVLCRRRLRGAT
jgi:hypothetical protein